MAASSLRGIRVEFVGGSGRDESASLRIFDGLFALGAGSAIPVFAVLHRQVLVVTRPHASKPNRCQGARGKSDTVPAKHSHSTSSVAVVFCKSFAVVQRTRRED